MSTKQQEYSAGLRALADFYDENPEFPTPIGNPRTLWAAIYMVPDEEEKVKFAQMVRTLGKTKKTYGNEVDFRRDFGGGVIIGICITREVVCIKRVVGTKIIPAQSFPERTEEIVEWDCRGSILESLQAESADSI